MQHAWAEIEHDLGYKGEITVPENLKRSFNRLSALLETADIEFDRLKKDLELYEKDIKNQIRVHPNEVVLDQASISAFIDNNQILKKANEIARKNTGCMATHIPDWNKYLLTLDFVNIKTVGELSQQLELNKKHYLSFVNEYTSRLKGMKSLSMAVGLFYFLHFMAAKTSNLESITKYFEFNGFPLTASTTPKDFIEIFKKSKS